LDPYSPPMTQNRNDDCMAGCKLLSAILWFEEHTCALSLEAKLGTEKTIKLHPRPAKSFQLEGACRRRQPLFEP
jgi:hypothetical protein